MWVRVWVWVRVSVSVCVCTAMLCNVGEVRLGGITLGVQSTKDCSVRFVFIFQTSSESELEIERSSRWRSVSAWKTIHQWITKYINTHAAHTHKVQMLKTYVDSPGQANEAKQPDCALHVSGVCSLKTINNKVTPQLRITRLTRLVSEETVRRRTSLLPLQATAVVKCRSARLRASGRVKYRTGRSWRHVVVLWGFQISTETHYCFIYFSNQRGVFIKHSTLISSDE